MDPTSELFLISNDIRRTNNHMFRVINDGLMNNLITVDDNVAKVYIKTRPSEPLCQRKRQCKLYLTNSRYRHVELYLSQSVIDSLGILPNSTNSTLLLLNSTPDYETLQCLHLTELSHLTPTWMSSQSTECNNCANLENGLKEANERLAAFDLRQVERQFEHCSNCTKLELSLKEANEKLIESQGPAYPSIPNIRLLTDADIPRIPRNFVSRNDIADFICDYFTVKFLTINYGEKGRQPMTPTTVSKSWFKRFEKSLNLENFSAQEIWNFNQISTTKAFDIGDAIFRFHKKDERYIIKNKQLHVCSLFSRCILNDLLPDSTAIKVIGDNFWIYLHCFVAAYYSNAYFLSDNSKLGVAMLARPNINCLTSKVDVFYPANNNCWSYTYYSLTRNKLPIPLWKRQKQEKGNEEWTPTDDNPFDKDEPTTNRV